MKKVQKGIMILGLCAVLAITPGTALAAESLVAMETNSEQQAVQPRIKWTGNAYVALNEWCNVTSSNNIFADSPTVTSYASNPGLVQLRIINEAGAQVGRIQSVNSVNSVTMDKIPALSGTYTLQARAVTSPGVYTFTVD